MTSRRTKSSAIQHFSGAASADGFGIAEVLVILSVVLIAIAGTGNVMKGLFASWRTTNEVQEIDAARLAISTRMNCEQTFAGLLPPIALDPPSVCASSSSIAPKDSSGAELFPTSRVFKHIEVRTTCLPDRMNFEYRVKVGSVRPWKQLLPTDQIRLCTAQVKNRPLTFPTSSILVPATGAAVSSQEWYPSADYGRPRADRRIFWGAIACPVGYVVVLGNVTCPNMRPISKGDRNHYAAPASPTHNEIGRTLSGMCSGFSDSPSPYGVVSGICARNDN